MSHLLSFALGVVMLPTVYVLIMLGHELKELWMGLDYYASDNRDNLSKVWSSSRERDATAKTDCMKPCPITLTPEQERESWVIKYQGGMWVKVLDLRKIDTVRLIVK